MQRISRDARERVSRPVIDVQLFATHRVVEGHAWASAGVDGLTRAFYYLGEADEVLLDQGPRTPFEERLECLEAGGDEVPDESTVMAVAEAWSVDPTQVDTRFPEAADGLLGTIHVAPVESPDDLRPTETGRPWWKLW